MNWDILNLDRSEWEHLQILDRLHDEGIDCYFADIWLDDIAIIIGYRQQYSHGIYEIATALNVPEEIIYYDAEHAFVIINLYQLKAIRAGYAKDIEKFGEMYGFHESV